jgi:hypothetical protein
MSALRDECIESSSASRGERFSHQGEKKISVIVASLVRNDRQYSRPLINGRQRLLDDRTQICSGQIRIRPANTDHAI